jgi:hypothetical protein
LKRLQRAGADDNEVGGAAAVGFADACRHVVAGVDCGVGAELGGFGEPVGADVGGDDFAGAGGAGLHDVEQPADAAAHDDDRQAGFEIGHALSADHAGQRLDKRAFLVRNVVG